MEKILLDTDIGTDIDDAVCLAYLLSQPECKLMGITTVSGESDKRAMLASALCKAAKKDIPIYPGIEQPLLEFQRAPTAPQAEALVNWDHDKSFPQGEAINFMRKTIRNNPGEITLLAIGPLTNVALLFSIDPEIPLLLKQLVLMCGYFKKQEWEYNAVCDPHATAMVYNAPVKIHRSIGLDVTLQVTMDKSEVEKSFTADILKPVLDFSKVWFEQGNTITFHDPLAAVSIFEPSVCSYERCIIDVPLTEPRKYMTLPSPDGENGRHQVAVSVDKNKFFNHYLSIVK